MADADYRAYIERASQGMGPSEVFMNRSPAHAAMVLEALFRSATTQVSVLSRRLSDDVYGVDDTVAGAQALMHSRPDAKINILVEQKISRSSNAFLSALDAAGFADRIDVRVVPAALQANYTFNFAVADGQNYRFESSRESREAMVQFRGDGMASRLEHIFNELSAKSTPLMPA